MLNVETPKDFPDHHDAELVLRAYDLRREPVLREARRVLAQEFWPHSLEDLLAVAKWEHPMNAYFRQVAGYWELVYGMARHGIVHAEYLVDASGGEGLVLLAKVLPFLEEFRKSGSPRFLQNTEWAATNTETGRTLFAALEPRVRLLAAGR
jgi:hypothetical protein